MSNATFVELLTSLEEIILSNNQIKKLPNFENFLELKSLCVVKNQITDFSQDFSKLSKLKQLYYDNTISKTPKNVKLQPRYRKETVLNFR